MTGYCMQSHHFGNPPDVLWFLGGQPAALILFQTSAICQDQQPRVRMDERRACENRKDKGAFSAGLKSPWDHTELMGPGHTVLLMFDVPVISYPS